MRSCELKLWQTVGWVAQMQLDSVSRYSCLGNRPTVGGNEGKKLLNGDIRKEKKDQGV